MHLIVSFPIKLIFSLDSSHYAGDNKRLETYFKTEKHGRNKSDKGSFTPPVAILPTKEAGLISVDTSSIKAAYQLACHPGMLFESIALCKSSFLQIDIYTLIFI